MGNYLGHGEGKKPIQRNAIIALAFFKDETAVSELISVLQKDVRPDKGSCGMGTWKNWQ